MSDTLSQAKAALAHANAFEKSASGPPASTAPKASNDYAVARQARKAAPQPQNNWAQGTQQAMQMLNQNK